MHIKFNKYFFKVLFLLLCASSLYAGKGTTDSLVPPDVGMPTDTVKVGNDTLIHNSESTSGGGALEFPVVYKSEDSIVFNVLEKKIYVYGQGDVIYDDIELKSEQISLDMDHREVYATGALDSSGNLKGKPNFKQGEEVFDADTMKYNFNTKRGLGYGIITEQEDGYLHSKKTKIYEDKEIHMVGGKYTTCDLEHPHYYIGMTKAKLIPDKQLVTGPAYIVIEDIPLPLIIPFGFFPTKKGRTNGILMPSPGENATYGYYLEDGGIYWGFSDYADLTITGDFYTLGSYRLYLSSDYKIKYKCSGSINMSYTSLVLDEVRQGPVFTVKWNHSQDAKSLPNSSFSANVDFKTAAPSKYTASTVDELYDNTLTSSIVYSKDFGDSPFGLDLSFLHSQETDDSTISLTLPKMIFSMSSVQPFERKNKVGKTRFYEDINVNYKLRGEYKLTDAKMDSTFYTKAIFNEFKKGFQQTSSISTTLSLLKYFTLTPSFNITDRIYFEQLNKEWDEHLVNVDGGDSAGVRTDTIPGVFNVYDYNFSAGMKTTLYGMYTFKNKYLKAVRHVIKPSVSLTYRPNFGAEKYNYWATVQDDEDGDMTSYCRYAGALYSYPSSSQSFVLNYGITNNLEMKVRDLTDTVTGTKKITLINSFSISSEYDFLADSLNMGLISLSGNTKLLKKFTINYSATIDPYALIYDKEEDELVRSNTYMINKYGRLGRYQSPKWKTSLSYQLGPVDEEKRYIGEHEGASLYRKFEVPWSLSLGYSISVPRTYYYNEYNLVDSIETDITQSLTASGKFTIADTWSVSFSTGWDFVDNEITSISLDFYKDLHCWEMSFDWIPIGSLKSWGFTIKVKADMFSDIKYDIDQPSEYLY